MSLSYFYILYLSYLAPVCLANGPRASAHRRSPQHRSVRGRGPVPFGRRGVRAERAPLRKRRLVPEAAGSGPLRRACDRAAAGPLFVARALHPTDFRAHGTAASEADAWE